MRREIRGGEAAGKRRGDLSDQNNPLQARSAGHLSGGSRVAQQPAEGGRPPSDEPTVSNIYRGGAALTGASRARFSGESGK
jgi:hypothetical protein